MNSPEIATYIIIAMLSMALSMAIIPVMMRLAPRIGMIDAPDSRKVHATPVPRVGGLGIVIGALVPMFLWLPYNDLTVSILLGILVLLVFGTWDDIAELGHYAKFVGQFIAAGLVVYLGDLYVVHFPFVYYDTIPESIGRPFTVIAIVGMINAINHSDGLDGLAGGESLISLGVITYLAMVFESIEMLILSAATIGGIFGFLRFNSHPARVFMGDGGSQFLGFILAVLVIMLTQKANPAMSSAIPLLVLGLPIIDILAVFFLRWKNGLNLFKATRNHIHHRLLDIGFYHYESVIFIYTVQLILVVLSVTMLYELDSIIVATYIIICGSVFAFLTISEKKGLKLHNESGEKSTYVDNIIKKYPLIQYLPIRALEVGVSLFVLASALVVEEVPKDFSVISVVLMGLFIITLITGFLRDILYRLILFVTIGFSVYLMSTYPVNWLDREVDLIIVYFIIMSCVGFVAIKSSSNADFRITPMDYLVIAMVVLIELVTEKDQYRDDIHWMVIQIIILFYLCEFLIQNMKSNVNRFSAYFALALGLIAYRGLS